MHRAGDGAGERGAVAPDGRPHIFLHAFRAGAAGYKAFRALLAAPIRFERGRVALET